LAKKKMLKFSGSEIIYRLASGESNELGSGSVWERSRNWFETTYSLCDCYYEQRDSEGDVGLNHCPRL